jgi:hypothetical protein
MNLMMFLKMKCIRQNSKETIQKQLFDQQSHPISSYDDSRKFAMICWSRNVWKSTKTHFLELFSFSRSLKFLILSSSTLSLSKKNFSPFSWKMFAEICVSHWHPSRKSSFRYCTKESRHVWASTSCFWHHLSFAEDDAATSY